MYGFGGVGLSEVQISISELSVVGGWVGGWVVGGLDKRTSWSDLVGVRQSCTTSYFDYLQVLVNYGYDLATAAAWYRRDYLKALRMRERVR